MEHAKQLAAGNDVKARARTNEQVQNSPIRIRFYRITNQVIQRRERGIESSIVIKDCFRAVDVSWRAEFLGNTRQIDVFAVQPVVSIMEKMHTGIYRQQPAISKSLSTRILWVAHASRVLVSASRRNELFLNKALSFA